MRTMVLVATERTPLLDRSSFRLGVAVVFVGVLGFVTYLPVLIVRAIADDTPWPVPSGERWVVTFTIAWIVVMSVALLGMALYVVDSVRRRPGAPQGEDRWARTS